MNYLDTVAGLVKGVMKPIENIVDKTTTSQEERGEIKAKISKVLTDSMLAQEQELTKRLQADMNSDSWLSKNIRPLTLLFVLGMYSLFSVLDGNLVVMDHSFNISDAYVSLLGQWGMLIMSFYFGGRSAEKIMDKISLARDKFKKKD